MVRLLIGWGTVRALEGEEKRKCSAGVWPPALHIHIDGAC